MGIKSLRDVRSFLLLLAAVTSTSATKCSRLIDGTTMPRSSAEEKYHLFITLFNRSDMVFSYMPNTKYTVTLQADSTDIMPRKFTRFLISAEAEKEDDAAESGIFDLQDELLTTYSESCPNAVVETSKMSKEEISVAWTSPSEGSGCIFIRATILETPDTWYMDDQNLVLKICQDSRAEADDQGQVLKKCCACDEAKYEVTFEGLWSRNTHPKDFPSKGWLIRFSDVIGASHTVDYRFWKYDGLASPGLQQLAELGSTRKLESELKSQSKKIRTIIKARGISYPNVTGKTFAVFRVDREHHLMSLVSMIDPSPDWIVGVSGLELCLDSCTWIEHKELNLYPYDAGTDNGITYLSPDSPTEPQEPIRRITSSYPNDSKSPFYDPSGLDMKPLARLYLNRQRLYEKACKNASEDAPSSTDTGACKVTAWRNWTACSTACGRGTQLRQRYYENEAAAVANKCNVSLSDRRQCLGHDCNGERRSVKGCSESEVLHEWSDWSECSTTCGRGIRTRTRAFKNKKYKQCKAFYSDQQLQQTDHCTNSECDEKNGEEVSEMSIQKEENDNNEDNDNKEDYEEDEATLGGIEEWSQKCIEERYMQWSLWSPCSSSCGSGTQTRFRMTHENWKRHDDVDPTECRHEAVPCQAKIASCNFTKEEAEEFCKKPKEEGRCNGNIIRWYFDKEKGCKSFKYSGCDGNENNFPTEQDCKKVCDSYQKDLRTNLSTMAKNYKVSLSSVLSYHIPAQGQRSTKTKRAHHEKLKFRGIEADSQMKSSYNAEDVDCQVSEWSSWSKCAGCRGYKNSTREIKVPHRGKGKRCPTKLHRKRKCRKDPLCSLQADVPRRRIYRDQSLKVEENQISVDCKTTQWSRWSRCTATCGETAQHRTRMVKVQPFGPRGKLCPSLVEYRKCYTGKCP
ncbi:spondin-1 isoform X1 [Bombus vosnesenskii]|uniref:Spondin-1 n=1 Tax=Bombus vosnesenskii TaxID=207650 RepID=A0A6J3L6P9_9HYME|nr:spondin-1 isoform X1 [Bombus vosnesenskii]